MGMFDKLANDTLDEMFKSKIPKIDTSIPDYELATYEDSFEKKQADELIAAMQKEMDAMRLSVQEANKDSDFAKKTSIASLIIAAIGAITAALTLVLQVASLVL